MSEAGGQQARRRTGPALEAMYRFMLWLVPTVDKFPRSQKFLLGDRIQATARVAVSDHTAGGVGSRVPSAGGLRW